MDIFRDSKMVQRLGGTMLGTSDDMIIGHDDTISVIDGGTNRATQNWKRFHL